VIATIVAQIAITIIEVIITEGTARRGVIEDIARKEMTEVQAKREITGAKVRNGTIQLRGTTEDIAKTEM
jgi:hypothetical protein